MKLTKIRIQNYKKINDTGWVECKQLTTFVGKNEAGKSALFRGLSKLNPSDGQKYDGLKEFPRQHFSSDFEKEDWIASSAEFEFTKEEKAKLKEILPSLDADSVVCSRHYSNEITVELSINEATSITIESIRQIIQKLKTTNESVIARDDVKQSEQVTSALSECFNDKLEKLNNNQSDTVNDELDFCTEIISKICAEINSTIPNDMKEYFKKIIDEKNELEQVLQNKQRIDDVKGWVKNNMPQFIYFDRYDVIDSTVHLGDFIHKLNTTPDESRIRTTKCLFEHAGLDVNIIQKLDPMNSEEDRKKLQIHADERAIRLSSASAEMTKKFSGWWEQRKHRFHYKADANHFRVWVSDDLDPSEIELDQRSAGMQYFFSFYLIFLVESKKTHRNSILLLDEPGLHYHGTAQMKAVEFLRKLSDENQVMYTTHSPFMIDGNHLEECRIVYEDNETGYTKVSDDVWPHDDDSVFPLQAGLGYSIAQTLFQGNKQLIVEGLTDYSVLKAMDQLLSSKNRIHLNQDIIITPAGGVRNLMPLASMFKGKDINMVVLLDADSAGINKQKEIQNKLLVDCVTINAVTDQDLVEIEDLFADLYIEAVRQQYKDVDLDFPVKKTPGISKHVQALFKHKNKEFEKWRPTNIVVEWMRTDSNGKIPAQTCKYFESLFQSINEKFDGHDSAQS